MPGPEQTPNLPALINQVGRVDDIPPQTHWNLYAAGVDERKIKGYDPEARQVMPGGMGLLERRAIAHEDVAHSFRTARIGRHGEVMDNLKSDPNAPPIVEVIDPKDRSYRPYHPVSPMGKLAIQHVYGRELPK